MLHFHSFFFFPLCKILPAATKRGGVSRCFFPLLASLLARGICAASEPCGSSLLVSGPELSLCSGWWETVWMRNLPRKPKPAVAEEEGEGKRCFSCQIIRCIERALLHPRPRNPAQTLLPQPGQDAADSVSCSSAEVVAPESCHELLFSGASVTLRDQWELVAFL